MKILRGLPRRLHKIITIKRRIYSYVPTGQPVQASANPTPVEHRQTNSTPTISQAVSAELEDGNVSATLRILMSDDSPVIPSPQSLNAMLEKHPPLPCLLICQLLIRSSAYLLRNPRFVKLFFFHFLLAQRAVQMACALNIVMAC